MNLPYQAIEPTLRSTGMKTLHKCRRKFLWQERYGLRRGIDSEALRIGTYVHLMLKQRYDGNDPGEAYKVAVLHADVQREKLQMQLRDGILPSGDRYEGVSRQMTSDLEKAFAMVDAFLAYYPLTSQQRVVATELHFKFQAPAITQPLEGQIDLVLVNEKTRKLSIVDIKTHSVKTTVRAATNVFDVQTHLFYVAGLQAILASRGSHTLPGYGVLVSPPPVDFPMLSPLDLTAVEYHLIKKPTIKCCKTDGYDLGNYVQRVRKWYDIETEKNPSDPPLAFTSQPVRGNPLEDPENIVRLEEYDLLARADPQRFTHFYKTANETECAGIFGTCPFLDLCRTDKARGQWAPMLENTYRQEYRS